MNKPLLIIGLLVISGMLLVPPREVRVYDAYGAAADEMIGGMDAPAEHRSTQVVYRPIGAEVGDELDTGEQIRGSRLATNRLLLQVVVAVVVFGGLGLIIGKSKSDAPEQ
jgi:hypothetical protein